MVYRIFKLRFAGWEDGSWLLAIQGKAGWIGMPSPEQAAAHLILASRSASRDGEFLQVVTKPEQDFQISYEMDPEKNDGTQKTVIIEFSALSATDQAELFKIMERLKDLSDEELRKV